MQSALLWGVALCAAAGVGAVAEVGSSHLVQEHVATGLSSTSSRRLMQPGGGGGGPGGEAGGDAGGGPGSDAGGGPGGAGGGPEMGGGAGGPAAGPADPGMMMADAPAGAATTTTSTSGTASELGTITPSEYYVSYTIEEETFGTFVDVVVNDTYRTISSNGIPPWDTSEHFPNPDNEYTVEEQDLFFEIPLTTNYLGTPSLVREVGISVFGVMYEPGNAQRASCDDGTQLSIEAFENPDVGFGIDPNGAHVRDNNGLYHYHGPSTMEIAVPDESQDIVHVGFAFDGHYLYYSRSGAYASSYVLSEDLRANGANCTYSEPDIPEFVLDTVPDGSIYEDWIFTEGAGDLDECNGIQIDGEYAYFITDTFPYVPRCLMGEAFAGDGTQMGLGGGPGGPGGGAGPGGPGGPGDMGPAAGPEADMVDASEGPEAGNVDDRGVGAPGATEVGTAAAEAAGPESASVSDDTSAAHPLGAPIASALFAFVALITL